MEICHLVKIGQNRRTHTHKHTPHKPKPNSYKLSGLKNHQNSQKSIKKQYNSSKIDLEKPEFELKNSYNICKNLS